jgi:hypothetical protein
VKVLYIQIQQETNVALGHLLYIQIQQETINVALGNSALYSNTTGNKTLL